MTTNSTEGVVCRYLEWMAARKLSTNTRRTAAYVLGGLSRWADGPILYLTRDDLQRWQCERADHLSAGSLYSRMSYIHAFYVWAVAEGFLQADPSAHLDRPRLPRRTPRPIEDVQLAEALRAAVPPVLIILALAGFAGLRACEIGALDWSEVVLVGVAPHLRITGKGGHERVVDLSPVLIDYLRALPHRSGPVIRRIDGQAGCVHAERISQLANLHLHSLGIPDTLHSLRHRFGTAVHAAGGDLLATQEAMGHASPTSTAGYARVARRNVRAAVLAAAELRTE